MEVNNQLWPYNAVSQAMEPIPEEEDYISPGCSYMMLSNGSAVASNTCARSIAGNCKDVVSSSPEHRDENTMRFAETTTIIESDKNNGNSVSDAEYETRTVESTQRLCEKYTTEEVDTLVSTLPQDAVPEEWKQYSSEEVVVDPSMSRTYVTEMMSPTMCASLYSGATAALPPDSGLASTARSSKYSYTYESHSELNGDSAYGHYPTTTFSADGKDDQADAAATTRRNGVTHFDEDGRLSSSPRQAFAEGADRNSTSTQKVTRVTKITTTRCVKQIPVDPNDLFFDADGNPILNQLSAQQLAAYETAGTAGTGGGGGTSPLSSGMLNGNVEEMTAYALGIDLTRTFIDEHETETAYASACRQRDDAGENEDMERPSAPGAPTLIETDDVAMMSDGVDAKITLAWRRPARDGMAGEILGYQMEFRRSDDPDYEWTPAHDDLLGETECKITNLDPLDAYYFRVRAANCAGFGAPSASTPPIRPAMPHEMVVDENAPAQPNRPVVMELDGDRATIEWHIPTSEAMPLGGAEVVGYIVEYRPANASAWLQSNDYPISGPTHQVGNLRPNGDYEFRITARDADGRLSIPSASSGVVRIRPAVPVHADDLLSTLGGCASVNYDSALTVPGPPKAIILNNHCVQLEWEPSCFEDSHTEPIGYLVEARQLFSSGEDDIGISLCADTKTGEWHVVAPPRLSQRVSDVNDAPKETIAANFPTQNVYVVENLRADAEYEFRISAVALQSGRHSAPSAIVRLQPREGSSATDPMKRQQHPAPRSRPPERPVRPEYLDFDGGNSVTLCWIPAKSVLPVLGYEVEFRDQMQDATRWYKLTDQLVRSCKTTVGYLIHGHQYQFRILAKNAVGHSPPSDPSPLITIGASLKDAKYVEAERHAAVALLQDEMIRESPPLPDRDDSPPPIYRQTGASSLQWRDPTLKEVIDYLRSGDPLMVENASGYLQHLTFNNDAIKEDTRNYGGIPNLVSLLENSDNVEILRNACGTLKNLAFGRNNDANKKEINACGGVRALARVMVRSSDVHVLEEASGALWNLSSCDELKEPVLNHSAGAVVSAAVVPFSDIGGAAMGSRAAHVVFRNGVGTLRNVSAVNATARKLLRDQPHLIDALLLSLSTAVERNDLDNRTVENCVGVLRNLSYRVQEVVDPKYDPSSRNSRHNNSSLRQQADQSAAAAAAASIINGGASRGGSRERSRSAPHSVAAQSPRSRKLLFKKSKALNGGGSGSGFIPQPSLLPNGKSLGAQQLWHPETIRVYLRILLQCTSMEILEATAAAIQNLAACSFDGGRIVRETVRLENGLPILGELLKLSDDRVVCAMVNALRNLVFDAQNLELIFENAMPELVAKLPRADQTPGQRTGTDDGAPIGDSTISAVLGILWEAMRQSADRTRKFHRAGGSARLQALARAYPVYGMRVCKYATQVLYTMWQHRELHEMFRRDGMRDVDFFAGTLSRGKKSTTGATTPTAMAHDTATLGRAISTQGPERPMHRLSRDAATGEPAEPLFNYNEGDDDARDGQQQATQNGRFTVSPTLPSSGDWRRGSGMYGDAGSGSTRSHHSATNNVAMTNGSSGGGNLTNAEPLYASVHKRNGVDSWV